VGDLERKMREYFFVFFSSSLKFFPFCWCNHLFIGGFYFGLKVKQTKINHWISRINLNHSFNNLEAKQTKMDPCIKEMGFLMRGFSIKKKSCLSLN
jgi:hypothetical protein